MAVLEKFSEELDTYCSLYFPRCNEIFTLMENKFKDTLCKISDGLELNEEIKKIINDETELFCKIKKRLKNPDIKKLFKIFDIDLVIVSTKIDDILMNNEYNKILSIRKPEIKNLRNLFEKRLQDSIRLSAMFIQIIDKIKEKELNKLPTLKNKEDKTVLPQISESIKMQDDHIKSLENNFKNFRDGTGKVLGNVIKLIDESIKKINLVNEDVKITSREIENLPSLLQSVTNETRIDELLNLHKISSQQYKIKSKSFKSKTTEKMKFEKSMEKKIRNIIDENFTVLVEAHDSYCDISVTSLSLNYQLFEKISNAFKDEKSKKKYKLQDCQLETEPVTQNP